MNICVCFYTHERDYLQEQIKMWHCWISGYVCCDFDRYCQFPSPVGMPISTPRLIWQQGRHSLCQHKQFRIEVVSLNSSLVFVFKFLIFAYFHNCFFLEVFFMGVLCTVKEINVIIFVSQKTWLNILYWLTGNENHSCWLGPLIAIKVLG